MTEEQLFFIKTLDVIPIMSLCNISWYIDDYTDGIVGKMTDIISNEGCNLSFLLTEGNKTILQNASKENNIEEDIFHMEVNKDGLKLLEAYDAFATVIISPLLKLSEEYMKEFVGKKFAIVREL